MKKIKILFITVFLVLAASLCLTACGSEAPAKYDDSGYKGSTSNESDRSITALETDPFLTLDGALDENVWQGQNEFDFTRGAIRVRTTTVYGKLGFYVGMRVTDPHIYCNGERPVYLESSVEIYIDRCDSVVKSYRTLNFRMSALGITEMYTGYLSPDGYNWTPRYMPVEGKVQVDGEINSGNTRGLTAEIFVRWDAFGYDYTADGFTPPDAVRILPCYNESSGPRWEDDRIQWACSYYSDIGNIEGYWLFDENGYAAPDRAGAVVGDNSPAGRVKTVGWLPETANGEVTLNYGGKQYIYFKDVNAENYMFTADIEYHGNNAETTNGFFTPSVNPSRDGDPFPKAGIMLGSNDRNTEWTYVLDYAEGKRNANGEGMFLRPGWWYLAPAQSGIADTSKKVRLTGVKYGENLFVFAGDENTEKYGGEFVAFRSEPDMQGNAVPGFFSLGACVTFSDYAITTDEEAIENKIANLYTAIEVEECEGGSVSDYYSGYERGAAVRMTVRTQDGFKLKSLKLNGKEKIADLHNGVLTFVAAGEKMTVVPVFERVTDDEYMVSGAVVSNIAIRDLGLLVVNDDHSYALPVKLESDGSYYMFLVPGEYSALVSYGGGFVNTFDFTVNAEDTELEPIDASILVFDSANGVTYNEDGSVTLGRQTAQTLSGVTAQEGFVFEYTVQSTAVFGGWNAGGLLMKIDGNDYRLFIAENGDGWSAVWFNLSYGGEWAQGAHAYQAQYALPQTVTVAYLNGTYHIKVGEMYLGGFGSAEIPGQNGKDLSGMFAAGTRKLGLCAVDCATTFSDVKYTLGDEAAQKAIDDMRAVDNG